jgi:triacylglycerol lipase
VHLGRSLTALALTIGVLSWVGGPAAGTDPGPVLTVSEASLAAATHCDATAMSGSQTVLLIHGTGATPDEAWSWNYEKALPAAGFGVCTVALPDRALGDFTVSAQYAVYAARYAYRVSGQKIAIIGHSQGGLMAVWIAKFWPDVAQHSTDIISLAGNLHGTALANTLCSAGSCSLIAWQMAMGSHLTTAASNAPLPGSTSFTSIGSRDDEVVFPQPYASTLAGARTIMLQDVCPVRLVDHGLLLSDAVAYRLVLDALTHDGPASTARISPLVCLQTTMPGTDPVGSAQFANTLVALSVGLLNATRWIDAEPALPPYAAPYGG